MTALDIIVFVALGMGAITGFSRGLAQELLSVIAWAMVVVAVGFLHTPVTALLVNPVGSESGAAVLAFLAIAAIVYAIGRWMARSVGRRSRQSLLGPFDRVLGFGFGIIKGLIISTLLFLLVVLVFDTLYGSRDGRPEWIVDARTYPLMNASGNAMSAFIRDRQAGEIAGDDTKEGGVTGP